MKYTITEKDLQIENELQLKLIELKIKYNQK